MIPSLKPNDSLQAGHLALTVSAEIVARMETIAARTARTRREVGFPVCRKQDGSLFPGATTSGNAYSMDMKKCPANTTVAGRIHTHPGWDEAVPSPGDLLSLLGSYLLGERALECVIAVPEEGQPVVRCAALRAENDQRARAVYRRLANLQDQMTPLYEFMAAKGRWPEEKEAPAAHRAMAKSGALAFENFELGPVYAVLGGGER